MIVKKCTILELFQIRQWLQTALNSTKMYTHLTDAQWSKVSTRLKEVEEELVLRILSEEKVLEFSDQNFEDTLERIRVEDVLPLKVSEE